MPTDLLTHDNNYPCKIYPTSLNFQNHSPAAVTISTSSSLHRHPFNSLLTDSSFTVGIWRCHSFTVRLYSIGVTAAGPTPELHHLWLYPQMLPPRRRCAQVGTHFNCWIHGCCHPNGQCSLISLRATSAPLSSDWPLTLAILHLPSLTLGDPSPASPFTIFVLYTHLPGPPIQLG